MGVDHHTVIVDDLTESRGLSGSLNVEDKVICSASFRASRDVVPPDAAILSTEHDTTKGEKQDPSCLEYTTYLFSLAVFGIMGVISRFGLKLLSERKVTIGSKAVSLINDGSFLYPDLVSNMIGSFLMGWLDVVFKSDLSNISDQLAVGLSTGFLGCLTTFSGWNQSVLKLSVDGRWGYAVLCVIIGFILAGVSIALGVRSAKTFRGSKIAASFNISNFKLNKSKFLVIFFTILLVTLVMLWGSSAALEAKYFKKGSDEAELFLGCLFGPFGSWLRWYLARLNGRGLGKNCRLKWLPLGTLAANVVASCIMAAVSTMNEMVEDRNFVTVAAGFELGFLGSLSTTSTLMSELYEMGRRWHPLRVVCYAAVTVVPSLGLGTLIYSVPIWVKK